MENGMSALEFWSLVAGLNWAIEVVFDGRFMSSL